MSFCRCIQPKKPSPLPEKSSTDRMASTNLKLSYRRLRQAGEEDEGGRKNVGGGKRRRRPRLRIARLRFLLRRHGGKVRASLRKVVGRLNEARSHFGYLFSGNYMFMQVNPAPLGRGLKGKEFGGGYGAVAPPSGYYLPRVG